MSWVGALQSAFSRQANPPPLGGGRSALTAKMATCRASQVSHADYDMDGNDDLLFLVEDGWRLFGKLRAYGKPAHSVVLHGTRSNAYAVGARVTFWKDSFRFEVPVGDGQDRAQTTAGVVSFKWPVSSWPDSTFILWPSGMRQLLLGEQLGSEVWEPFAGAGLPNNAGNGTEFTVDIRPVPVGRGASIEFWLPAATMVSLDLFDVIGRRVWSKLDIPGVAGRNRFMWTGVVNQGVTCPRGRYFLRCKCAAGEVTRALTVMR